MAAEQPSEFDHDTAVTRAGPGRFNVDVPARWSTGPGANGGFVAGLLTKAALTDASVDQPLRTVSVHYLRPASPGPAHVTVAVVHSGRTTSLIDVVLERDDKLLTLARVTLSAHRDVEGGFLDRQPPGFPPPEQVPTVDWYDDPNYIRSRFDTRFVVGGRPPIELDRCESSGWLRTIDHAPVTVPLLVTMTDSFLPPPVMRAPHWGTSTLNLTVHVFEPDATPIDDFLAITNRSTVASAGHIDTDTEIWTRNGRLLAQGRQLSLTVPWAGGDLPPRNTRSR